MNEEHSTSLKTAFDELRAVQLTLDENDDSQAAAEEALNGVIRDLETVMSDHFDMYVS